MFRKILTPFDGSLPSEEAYALALEFAEKHDSEVVVLFVARPPEPRTGTNMSSLLAIAHEHCKSRFDSMKRRADNLKVRFDVQVGQPAETILEVAQRDSIDLIIMGRRGKSASRRWPLGTVSDRVLAHASCAVLAVA